MSQRDILEQRIKIIGRRRETLVTELEELDIEAQELVIALRVYDRYAIRFDGKKAYSRVTQKAFEAGAEVEKTAFVQPDMEKVEKVIATVPLQTPKIGCFRCIGEATHTETRVPLCDAHYDLASPEDKLEPDNGLYKPLADALGGEFQNGPDDEAFIQANVVDEEIAEEEAFGPVTHAIVDVEAIAKNAELKQIVDEVPLNPSPPLKVAKPFDMRSKAEPVPHFVKSKDIHHRAPGKKPATSEERKYGTKEPEPETIAPKDETLERIKTHLAEPEPFRPDMRTHAGKQARVDSELHRGRKDGKYNVDTSGKEPPPAWRGKPSEPSNINFQVIRGQSFALAGSHIMLEGKIMATVDRWEKAAFSVLINSFDQSIERKNIRGMVKDIDNVIGELRNKISLTPAKIETTNNGWKLCQR